MELKMPAGESVTLIWDPYYDGSGPGCTVPDMTASKACEMIGAVVLAQKLEHELGNARQEIVLLKERIENAEKTPRELSFDQCRQLLADGFRELARLTDHPLPEPPKP